MEPSPYGNRMEMGQVDGYAKEAPVPAVERRRFSIGDGRSVYDAYSALDVQISPSIFVFLLHQPVPSEQG